MRGRARDRLIDAAAGRRAGILAALLAALILLLVGCSGRPDVAGEWGGSLTFTEVNEKEEEAALGFDLDQDDADGSLSGTMSLDTGDGPWRTPISSGEISESGSVQIEIESQDALDPEPLTFSGEMEGDQMSGEVYGVSEEGASFSVERGGGSGGGEQGASSPDDSGETVQSSDDEGDFVTPETTSTGQSSRELVARYNALDEELALMAEELESRIARLESPAEDLEEALGPDTREPEIYDCASDPVSCEVAALEDQVEQDRREFEEEVYGPAGCEAAEDTDYYAALQDFDSSGGETYITERGQVSEAADGIEEYARETVEQARETRAAYEEALDSELNAGLYEPSRSVSELETQIADAGAAESRANEAITEAEQRYGALESRAKEALAEAEALYARAGCAI